MSEGRGREASERARPGFARCGVVRPTLCSVLPWGAGGRHLRSREGNHHSHARICAEVRPPRAAAHKELTYDRNRVSLRPPGDPRSGRSRAKVLRRFQGEGPAGRPGAPSLAERSCTPRIVGPLHRCALRHGISCGGEELCLVLTSCTDSKFPASQRPRGSLAEARGTSHASRARSTSPPRAHRTTGALPAGRYHL